MKKMIPTVCGAMLLAAPAACADTLTIAYQYDGQPMHTFTNPVGDSIGVVDGPWTLGVSVPTGGATQGWELDAISRSNSTLDVYATVQNKTAPYTVASIQQWIRDLPTTWTLQDQIFVDPNNGLFGGQQLDYDIFAAPTGSPGDVSQYPITLSGTTPYSWTVHWQLHSTDLFSPVLLETTANVNIGQDGHPVPGPILGAGLPGLLAGALALFTFLRRRRS